MVKGFNFLNVSLVFWPEVSPSVETIENIIDLMMRKREKEIVYPEFSKEGWNQADETPFIIKKINFLRVALREVITRLLLRYLKTKKLKEGVVNNIFLDQ